MTLTRIGVYPGTFDPLTLGHLDIIRRGAHLVDRLVIGVTTNPSKEPMFTVAERLAMVRREIDGIAGTDLEGLFEPCDDLVVAKSGCLLTAELIENLAELGFREQQPG